MYAAKLRNRVEHGGDSSSGKVAANFLAAQLFEPTATGTFVSQPSFTT